MRNWHDLLAARLVLPSRADGLNERVIAELADHLEEVFNEALRNGASKEEAEAAAMESVGDFDRAAQELIDTEPRRRRNQARRWIEAREAAAQERGGLWSKFADVCIDLRLGLRSLGRRPLFSGIVVLVLALGIGGTAAMFSLVDAIVLSPLPYDEQDRLISLHHTAPAFGFGDAGQCAAWHTAYEQESQTLARVGMYSTDTVAVQAASGPVAVGALLVTSGVLDALALPPLLGRSVLASDEGIDSDAVALLSAGYWQDQFGSDPAVIGKTLVVDSVAHRIVGVLPQELEALAGRFQVVLPFRIAVDELYVGNIGFGAVGRLAEGVDFKSAQAELQQILPTAWDRFPGGPIATPEHVEAFSVHVVPLKQRLVGDASRPLWLLLAGVSLVLVVACANVANLLLVRAGEKGGEMALRSAVGASALRVRWEAFKETLLLCLMGGFLGLVLAGLGLRLLVATAPDGLPRVEDVAQSPRVLFATLCVSLLSSFVVGLLPVLRATGARGRGLATGGSRGVVRTRAGRLQTAVAAAQVAVVLALLVASGLMLRSFLDLQRLDLGFNQPQSVHTLRLHVPADAVPDIHEAAIQFQTIAHRLEEIPGVDAVAMATAIPMDGSSNVNSFYTRQADGKGRAAEVIERHKWVGGGFFSALQVPLLAGRELSWADVEQRRPVAMVSASMAKKYWGSAAAAIGQSVAARPNPVVWHEVVGVAADVRDDGVAFDAPSMVYWPQVVSAFWPGTDADSVLAWRDNGFAIRGPRVGDPGFLKEVQTAIWGVNSSLPLLQSTALGELVDRSMSQWLFLTRLLVLASLLALVLGVTGVYGLISNSVSQQVHELGIRLAFGARASDIQFMVLKRGLVICAMGSLIGLGLCLGLRQVIGSILVGVRTADPLVFLLASLSLSLVVLAACYLPARRAASIDPMTVMRGD